MTTTTSIVRDETTAQRVASRRWAATIESLGLPIALMLVIVGFSIAMPDTFATVGNLQAVLGSQAVLLVLALGLLFPLVAGEFDLSAAAILSLSAMILAVLNVQLGVPIVPAAIVALLVGIAAGALNGVLVVVIGIDSFIATLGVSTVLLGLVEWLSAGTTVTGVDSTLSQATIGTRFGGLALSFWFGLLLTVVVLYLLDRTSYGRRLLFVGRGRAVAELTGVRVSRLRFGAFVMSGLVASLAGILYVGTLGGADPTSGQSFLLPAFAACFLGATSIRPGRFNAIGTFIAVYFLIAGITGLQLLGARNFVQQLFYGGALIVAVSVSILVRRSRRE